MSHAGRLGILGGTFDPIHFGHLDATDAARAALALDEMLLIPAHDPPHRSVDPRASTYHRFALVSLAIANRQGYRVSDVEVVRPGPSYTADTLRDLQAHGWQASQLFFILGTDAFSEIATWYAFPALLDLAHFVVIARPGTTIEQATDRVPALRPRVCTPAGVPGDLTGATRIVLVEARTRDVSSTVIRRRVAAAQRIDDLVPASVAQHILTNRLYGAVGNLHGKEHRGER